VDALAQDGDDPVTADATDPRAPAASKPVPSSTRLAEERTHLALDRTRLAQERTLMAWVRTATSLITFGFTIYKAFQFLQDNQIGGVIRRRISPREFGMIMIALGIGALTLATLQHRKEVRELYRDSGWTPPWSVAGFVATVISCLGIITLIVVFFRQ